MNRRSIRDRVEWLGAIDWDRRLFDSLIPLPDGTSYNAYLVRGSEATVLLDTVDPPMTETLLGQLADVERIDYLVSHHAEQDHSGAIPAVLERHPETIVLCSAKAKPLLMDLLDIDEARIRVVADGETLSLGDRTLEFIYTPWVHWAETMCSYLREERLLFTCDFFGSHIASTELYVRDRCRVLEAAKRYFGEIMVPFRKQIVKNLEKLAPYAIDMILPSHGAIYDDPSFILDAYRDWSSDTPKNLVVIPFISMHGSTEAMVERLTTALAERGVPAERFNLAVTDIGKLATALIDAGTVVLATPTVLAGPHPIVAYAALLANALRPKALNASIIGSYGWGGQAVETLVSLLPNLKASIIDPVLCKGLADEETHRALDAMAAEIAKRHEEAGLKRP